MIKEDGPACLRYTNNIRELNEDEIQIIKDYEERNASPEISNEEESDERY